MKERDDSVCFQDHRGVIVELSIEQFNAYVEQYGSPFDHIVRTESPAGQSPEASREDPRRSVRPERRKDTPEANHPDSLPPGTGEKDPHPTRSFVVSGPNFGMQQSVVI